MNKKFLISIIIAFSLGFATAQPTGKFGERKAEVLKSRLNQNIQDTTRIRLLNQIARIHIDHFESDSCRKYALLALNQSNQFLDLKENAATTRFYLKQNAAALENLGLALTFQNVSIALDTLSSALNQWKEVADKKGIASVYWSISQAYSLKGMHFKALEYLDLSLATYQELGDQKMVARIWFYIGLEKRYAGNYGDALESNMNALEIGMEIMDTLTITDVLLANAFNYLRVEEYSEALKNQNEALRIFQIQKDSIGIATAYNDMGVTYMRAGKLKEALTHHKLALAMRKNLRDVVSLANSYNYISDILIDQRKLEEARLNSLEALKYLKQVNDLHYLVDAYLTLGDIYRDMQQYDTAMVYYRTANRLSAENKIPGSLAMSLTSIARIYRLQGNSLEAIKALREAEQSVLETDWENRMDIYKSLTQIFVDNADYKSAYENEVLFRQMADSMTRGEKIEKVTKLTQKFIFENKRALQRASQEKALILQQEQLKTQKLARNISFGALVIALLFAVLIFSRFREKRKLNIALEKSLDDLKSTQNQLVQSEKMASLGELTAGIAHEIQNPLNFVNNFSEVSSELIDEMNAELAAGEINEAIEISQDLKENLNRIIHHGKRADAIVKGMLQHSRSSGTTKEPTDINELADEYLRLAYHGLRAKDKTFNAAFHTDLDQSIGKITIIPQEIGRVLLNLITNAFYACNAKKQVSATELQPDYSPTVTISTKKHADGNYSQSISEGPHIEIKVKDNGNGIPESVREKIFQPFFTTKPVGEGTGLGLSLSFDIVRAHGGSLTVKSVEGEGSEFTINLPIT